MTRNARAEHLDEPIVGHLRRDLTPLAARQTVGEALDFLRSQPLGERIVYFYVVDADGRIVGVVPTRRLLMADPGTPVTNVMVGPVITLPESATLRDASDMFLKHRLLALPVVDAADRLRGVADVGLFTDEIYDVAARQTADDVFQLIGAHVTPPASAWRSFVDRFPWLLCNVGGGLVAALIAGWYEQLLASIIALALFIPVVLAVSESVGMQSVTLTLQRLHAVRVDWRFLAASVRRELAAAGLLGAGCGSVIAAVAWMWKGAPLLALAILVTVTSAMMTAALLGVAQPGALRAMRRDPRIASGPIVLALTDFVTLLVYFGVAEWFLR
jgi:magnesium transporter